MLAIVTIARPRPWMSTSIVPDVPDTAYMRGVSFRADSKSMTPRFTSTLPTIESAKVA